MRSLGAVLIVCSAVAAPQAARAEYFEKVVSLEGLLVLPAFTSQSNTAFAAASFGPRLSVAFGIAQDVYLLGRFAAWFYNGVVDGITETTTRGTYTGRLWFSGEGFRPELGVRWRLLSGHDIAPYAEGYVGYQWSTFRNLDLRNAGGGSYGLTLGDFARGRATVAGGLSADIRLGNMVFLGISVLWTQLLRENLYRGDLSLGARAAFYWF